MPTYKNGEKVQTKPKKEELPKEEMPKEEDLPKKTQHVSRMGKYTGQHMGINNQ